MQHSGIPQFGEQHELIEVVSLDPSLKLDVRYARTDNFVGKVVYDEPRVFLQKPVAEDLVRAHLQLKNHGFGLLLYDGYRPWSVTKIFWDSVTVENRKFVADPATGSVHNRGCAIDLSMYRLSTGEPVVMPSDFDEMTERSYFDYPGGTPIERECRDLLRAVMEKNHFYGIKYEWWHFNHRLLKEYPILNLPFSEL